MVKHLGDITKINGHNVPIVDVVTGGSPCQDLSVAGKRAGLDGERSGLFMEQIRIIKEMRNEFTKQLSMRGADVNVCGIKPRFMVWENVPGAFSSPGLKNGEDHRGEDFQAVLTEIVRVVKANAPDVPLPRDRKWTKSGCLMGIGDNGQPFSVAWRLHDAQFWGVPQRRKRIALVADFGGQSAPEILFERKSVSGDITESRKEGQGITTDIERGVDKAISFQERAGKPGGGKGILIQNEHTGALSTLNNQSVCYGLKPEQGAKAQGMGYEEEVAPTLNTSMNAGVLRLNSQGSQQMGAAEMQESGHQPLAYGISSFDSNAMKSSNPHSGIYKADTSRTLDLNGGSPACNQGGMMVVQGADMYNQTTTGDKSITIRAKADTEHLPCVVLEGNGNRPSHQGDGYKESDVSYTLNSTEQHAVCFEPGSMSRVGGHYYEDGKSGTLRANAGDNQQAVCFGNGQLHDAISPSVEVSKTLNCMCDPMKVLCYSLDRASFNQGKNAKYDFSVEEDLAQTLVARGPGGVLTKQ